jgi:photosystem II stability/assembly factor-like uncharacterized protein
MTADAIVVRMLRSLVLLMVGSLALWGQGLDPKLYAGLRWRHIGPFRAGRTVAATGVPGQPSVFYVAVNNGGVWRTNDYGRVWRPIFDDQPTGSIGAVAVAPSNPNVIYVGSGEGLQRPDLSVGDGMYKSTDAGKTWQHLGLRDGQQIAAILVDPRDANTVFVAVLGHPYGPNTERGIYRTQDGGRTWKRVLYKDENTGGMDLAFDPSNPDRIYAVLWSARQGPWENGAWQGPNSGLYVSTNGGNTWQPLTQGLPTTAEGLGRIGLAVSPSNARRVFAMVDAPRLGGLYRSDDAGQSWRRISSDPRLWGRGSDFAHVRVDPKNADRVYVANICSYRSDDGGVTFTAIKGAPGGDDYHTIWINPDDPRILLFAADQGAVISVNGGETWSSWYNQPTAQFYHVSTDNQFPYTVYGGQQESGSAAVLSRGNDGQITFREWHPVGVEEYGYVAPDPLNPDIIYGGKVSRYDRRTGEVQQVGPVVGRRGGGAGNYRFVRTMPLLFSPADPHVLFFAGNVVFKTINGGMSWDVISPDLTREAYEVPASVGVFSTDAKKEATRRGVVYALGPSPKDVQTLWAGTDDGLVHVTRDGGKTWKNVTPPDLTPWSKVSQIDAGHFDAETAYVAVNRFRLDDLRPHVYLTHDGGRTWKKIVSGLPDDPVNAVREDPVRKGLLFAATERAVFVSNNDGENWSPLRLNMPAISVRDIVVHSDDLVAGTHGRGFWILDDITPLRHMDNVQAAHLFPPQVAYRVRWNKNTDTPLPPEEPAGENPPDGAVLHYYLKSGAQQPVTLEILDQQGQLVRRYASDDKPESIDPNTLAIPTYWIRPHQPLQATAGMHRFVWDLRYAPPKSGRRSFPIAAILHNTASQPLGPAVLPGEYTARLTVDGKTSTQKFKVRMDPRIQTSPEGLKKQFDLSMRMYKLANAGTAAAVSLMDQLQSADAEPTTQQTAAVESLERTAAPPPQR